MKKRILMPVDLQDDVPDWIDEAIAFARDLAAEVVLLHVVDYVPSMFPVEMPPGYQVPQIDFVTTSARRRLEKLADRFADVPVTYQVDVGNTAHEIIERARKEEFDLIVLASHKRRGLKRWVLGSVAERVARSAPCAVMILR